jgi:hypothetical protein
VKACHQAGSGAVAALSSVTERGCPYLVILLTGAKSKPMEDHGQGRLRVMDLVILTVTGWPAITDGLTVILLGFNNVSQGGWPLFRTRGGLRRSAGTASCTGVRASATAAVGCGTKASGPPRGAARRAASCYMGQLSRRVACAVPRRQEPGGA